MKDLGFAPDTGFIKYSDELKKAKERYAKEAIKILMKLPRRYRQFAYYHAGDCIGVIMDEIIAKEREVKKRG